MKTRFLAGLMRGFAPLFVASSAFAFNTVNLHLSNSSNVSVYIDDSARFAAFLDSFNSYEGGNVQVSNDVDLSILNQKGKKGAAPGDNTITINGKNIQDVSTVINNSSRTEVYVDSYNSANGGSVNVTNDIDLTAGKKSNGQLGFLGSNSIQIRGKNMEDVSATINDSASTAVYLDSFNSTDATTVDVNNDIDITTGKKKGDKQPNAQGNGVGISGKNLHDVVFVISGNRVLQIDAKSFNAFMATGNLDVTNEISVP